ncbi:hypothetical protein YC2023_076778 [Brassica napus]
MSIVQNTTITRSPLVNEDMFLSLVDFQSVLSGSLNPNFLIDVIGQVMELGELETIQVAGNPRRKVEFTLRDINKEEEGKPICLIRFAKIGRYRGELQITNAFEASLLLINPAIPETVAFKQMWFVDEDKPLALWESNDDKLELDDVRSIQDKRDKWLLFPKRTIRELLDST